MDFELNEDHKLIRDTAKRLAREVVAPGTPVVCSSKLRARWRASS